LLPGLIDMHVHLDSPADIGGYRGLEFTDSFWGMTAVKNARAMLDAGFTTVRNVGSDNRNDIGLKQAIDNGYASRPAHRACRLCAGRDRRPLRLHLSSAQP
jgi:imidazolonepropionase-like amidohydrolase